MLGLFVKYYMTKTKYDYEQFYKNYPVDIHDEPGRQGFVAGLCRGTVMDIGCGTGTLSDYYLGDYAGFDVSKEAIKMAKETRRDNAQFVAIDCEEPSWLSFEGADTIVICEMLEHIESDEWLLNTIKKTARKGTRLIVSVPNDHEFDCDEHIRYFTIPVLRKKFEKLGKVQFYNWSGVRRQIILTVEIDYCSVEKLALVMIAKNEEKGLENAILSVIENVGQVCIAVDKSSSDKTRAVAAKYADVVMDYEWHDDFAEARNRIDEAATTDWRIFLDGHEYVKPDSIWPKLENTKHDGFFCTIEMENNFCFHNPRIYKKGVKFFGAVHEKQKCESVGYSLGLKIVHDRMGAQSEAGAAEREKQRNDMVPRIMGQQVKDNPGNTRALYHLALWAGSEKKYREAFKWSRKLLAISRIDQERWFVRFNMALHHLTLGHYWRAWWQANMAEDELSGRWETKKLKGLILAQSGRHADAVEWLILSQEPNIHPYNQRPWKQDSSGTWNLVADCYFKSGQFEKASIAWNAAAHNCDEKIVKDIYEQRAKLMEKIAIAQASEKN